jgi:uncharacterized protein (DUF58 family)
MSLSARMRFGEETVSVRFPDIPPSGTATRIAGFRPVRRGPVGVVAGTLSTRFPFSLFEKSMDVRIPTDLLVYPRPLPPGSSGKVLRDSGPSDHPWAAGRSGAFPRGAREQLPADPVRDIHWKATARMEKWMVKEREAEAASLVEIRVPVHRSPEEFEACLSEACGSVIELDRKGTPFRLWIGERPCSPGGGGRAAALAALAVARNDGGEIGPEEAEP